jgi:hypothetical protein
MKCNIEPAPSLLNPNVKKQHKLTIANSKKKLISPTTQLEAITSKQNTIVIQELNKLETSKESLVK